MDGQIMDSVEDLLHIFIDEVPDLVTMSTIINSLPPSLLGPLVTTLNIPLRSYEWDQYKDRLWIDAIELWLWEAEEDLSLLSFLWNSRTITSTHVDCEYDRSCRSYYEDDSIFFGIDIIDERVLDELSAVVPGNKTVYYYFQPASRAVPRRLRHRITTFLGGLIWGSRLLHYHI